MPLWICITVQEHFCILHPWGTVKGLLVVVSGIVCGVPVLVNMQAGEE